MFQETFVENVGFRKHLTFAAFTYKYPDKRDKIRVSVGFNAPDFAPMPRTVVGDFEAAIRCYMGKNFNNSVPNPPTSKYYAPPKDVKREFARRLSQRLRDRNMNQSDLARRAGEHFPGGTINRDLISNYVRGEHVPRPAALAAIARALDCEPTDLLPPGAAPSVDASDAPKLDIRTLDSGAVWVRVNAVLPWASAMAILEIVKRHETET